MSILNKKNNVITPPEKTLKPASMARGLDGVISKEKQIVKEMNSLLGRLDKVKEKSGRDLILSQIISLKNKLVEVNRNLPVELEKVTIAKGTKIQGKPLKKHGKPLTKTYSKKSYPKLRDLEALELQRETMKRLREKRGKKSKKIKVKKPSKYINISNRLFADFSIDLLDRGHFKTLKRDLIKANLQFLAKSYISVMFFTTLVSFLAAIVIFVFLLFFSIGAELPIITLSQEFLGARLVKIFWILFAIPIATYIFMYVYPPLEKKSLESKIDQELPFATIHMSSISGSMVEPSKIFGIIVETKEYPHLEKELIKIVNEINIFGHDLVTGLRNVVSSTPSKKLAELLNGLATSITSGGNLPEFFDKRAQSLLFEYRLEREKQAKAAETFMDIYISVVIAAPMILMLLLIIMRVSGLGISLSTNLISLIMILGVSLINVLFLTFLHLKQPTG